MKFQKALILFFLLNASLNPCSWCEKWGKKDPIITSKDSQNLEASNSKYEEKSDEDPLSGLGSLFSDDVSHDDFLREVGELLDSIKAKKTERQEEKKTMEVVPEVGQEFYKKYLATYYPRALVITDNFFTMCPAAIEAALLEVVDVVSKTPWFYFKNKPEGFKLGEYWEIILEQYHTLSRFLSLALIDNKTGKVFLPEGAALWFKKDNKSISLKNYWTNHGVDSFYDFHAHHCDFLVRMFNEGIHLEDYKQAVKYSFELEIAVRKLQGSLYEEKYQRKIKDNKWLLAELKKKFTEENSDEEYIY
ncbi:hypothetical protein KAW80_03640 [Candidatus Babeliales bacterium]|nr:hypothetical protein [Candidatus Babeliales bacterium]